MCRSRVRSSTCAASCSLSVIGGGIRSVNCLTWPASAGCPWRSKISLTARHPRSTSFRVFSNLAFPGSTCLLPLKSSLATASTRLRMCVESPRNVARYIPSVFRVRLCPRTARSVALAAMPLLRRCRANSRRHSRRVAFRIFSRTPCSLTALSHVSNCSLFRP